MPRTELPLDYDVKAATQRFLKEFENIPAKDHEIFMKNIGIQKKYLDNIRNDKQGKYFASLPLLVKMARVVKKPTDYFLYGEEASPLARLDLIDIPKIKNVLDENMQFQYEKTMPGSLFNVEWLRKITNTPEKLVHMNFYGDSMENKLFNGDRLAIDTSETKIVDGAIFAFHYNKTPQIVIRRLFHQNGDIVLVPDNKRYPTKTIKKTDIIIIGRVIMSRRVYIINQDFYQ